MADVKTIDGRASDFIKTIDGVQKIAAKTRDGATIPNIVYSGLAGHLDVANIGCIANASDQTLVDLTGNGLNYFRGADNTATTDDPTFNGTPGARSSAEYFSLDGSDKFKSTSSQTGTIGRTAGSSIQEATIEIWWYPGSLGASYAIWGNVSSGGGKGALLFVHSSDTIRLDLYPLGSTIINTATGFAAGAWRQDVVTLKADGTANGIKYYKNGALIAQGTANNSGFTTGDSEIQPEILSNIAGLSLPPNGTRFAIKRPYTRALTAAEVLQNFNANRARFGL